MNKNLPIEIINKILIMRPPHPIVKILREYVDCRCLDLGEVNNIIYCPYVYYFLQNNDFLQNSKQRRDFYPPICCKNKFLVLYCIQNQ